ncbi:MAG: hypothetical protein J6Z06_00830 [Lachnospiraceae bacterium]|jgi:septum site-determining protein MinC|nr:hypothetical protein [Lachnospiraceae bacterium]
MIESCTIKSNAHGITLILNPEVSFENLVVDICKKFNDARDFFGQADLIFSVEGRDLTSEEVAVIVEAIELNSDIHISLIQEKNQIKDIRMQGKIDRFYFENIYENAHIVMDSVKSGEILRTEQSVIILGDVKDGATVVSAGNVIIFGSLLGDVHAGHPGENSCYIIAGSYDGREVAIGTHRDEVEVEKPKRSLFKKPATTSNALAIVVYEDQLVCEPISRGIFKENRS